ncbi:MAG: glycosyltransferase family 2 protein [Arachidicoccus sp.]|nr:glycosyltransferase family 2 protein [Arachidicoccus sp.]
MAESNISNVQKHLVFAIIVNYNSSHWIKKCIESLRNSDLYIHIVIVDNNSKDDSIKIIKHTFNDVKIFLLKKNYGFGKANNIGIQYAINQGAEYVYLINQDAWIKRDTISTLIKVQKKHEEFGIVSPMHVTAKEDKFDHYFQSYCSPPLCPDMLPDLYFNRLHELYETRFVNAAHWLITRECISAVGGFSPSFYHYDEDGNYVDRVHYHGFKVGLCPHSVAIHDRETREINSQKVMYSTLLARRINAFSIITRKTNFFKNIYSFLNYIFQTPYYIYKFKSFMPIVYLFKFFSLIPSLVKNKNITKKRGANFLDLEISKYQKD